jgi:hypothetical protein
VFLGFFKVKELASSINAVQVNLNHSPIRIPVSLIVCRIVVVFFPVSETSWSISFSVGRNSGIGERVCTLGFPCLPFPFLFSSDIINEIEDSSRTNLAKKGKVTRDNKHDTFPAHLNRTLPSSKRSFRQFFFNAKTQFSINGLTCMVKRKSIDCPWCCSWDCGFKSWDIIEVVKHENNTRH